MSVSRRQEIRQFSYGQVDLPTAPRIGESLMVNDVLRRLRIKDIEHESGRPPMLVLDGTNLG